jgi:TetR/AcrR family fatty acid metabolism transcriptional regulator
MSSRATKRERVEEKESKIIAAARQIFLREGVDGTRMSEIAKLADVAEGTLYLYFKNKEALLHAISGAHWAELSEGARAAIADCDSAMDGFHALADYHMMILIKDWSLIELGVTLAGTSDAGHRATFSAKRDYASIFDDLFTRGVDRGEFRSDVELWCMRDLFYGTLEYSARTITIHNRLEDMKTAVVSMMRVFTVALVPDNAGDLSRAVEGNVELQAVTMRLVEAANKLEKLSS